MSPQSEQRSVAIVAGSRTPFTKAGAELASLSAEELGRLVVAELLERAEIDPREVEQLVFGCVIPSIHAPNLAREVVLRADLPPGIEAYTVSEACISGHRAVANVAQAIALGAIDCGVAGGADSASQTPMTLSPALRDALVGAREADTLLERIAAFAGLGPSDLLPELPDIIEPSTGATMGESVEHMVKLHGISREAQDTYACASHRKAAAAWEAGHFDAQVMTIDVPPNYERSVARDTLVRPSALRDDYAALEPVFDRAHGSVTAANSSALTDGASALLLMASERARELGLDVLATIRSFAFAAVDPADQPLLGPVYATPKALERAGCRLQDMAQVDMHEAFAGQVLSVLQAFGADERGLGPIHADILNVDGGSLALGHPFAATGGRQLLQLAHALARSGGGLGLCTACAAGGLGAAMIVEVEA